MHPRFQRQASAYAAAPVVVKTARDFARELNCEALIERALTYYPQITRKTWETRVEWDARLKNHAGEYHHARRLILLHPGLKLADFRQYREVFLHELAHAMQWLVHGKGNHGPAWHEMMYLLAQRPVRCHSIAECMAKIDTVVVNKVAKEFGL